MWVGADGGDLDRVDPCARWTVGKPRLELAELLRGGLGEELDPAVAQIANPSRHTDPAGRPLGGEPESNALDLASHSARDRHVWFRAGEVFETLGHGSASRP